MKKLLIPLLISLAAVWSCNIDGSYTAKNVNDIITVGDHGLVSDTGVQYTVTEVYKDAPAMEVGKRYYIVFDILNNKYEISISHIVPVQVVQAEEKAQGEEITAHDPIDVIFNWVGRSYMDLAFNYYYDKKSDCAHDVFVRYSITNGGVLTLDIYHDGADENPSVMDIDDLKLGTRIISIPIGQWEVSALVVTMDVLIKNTDGTYKVERKEYSTQ